MLPRQSRQLAAHSAVIAAGGAGGGGGGGDAEGAFLTMQVRWLAPGIEADGLAGDCAPQCSLSALNFIWSCCCTGAALWSHHLCDSACRMCVQAHPMLQMPFSGEHLCCCHAAVLSG